MKDITTTRHAETKCPSCGLKLDASSQFLGPAGPKPKIGDLTICIECGTILTYTDAELHLRLMTEDEIKALPVENTNDITRYRTAIRSLNEIRRTRN